MLKYTHDREFRIKYCETDFKDELKLSSVLAYFEEVAGSSADELGFGYQDLKPREIWDAAQKVYAGYPKLLEAARKTIFI